jgi:hypothetical protein
MLRSEISVSQSRRRWRRAGTCLRLRVKQPLLYRYFPSKEDLIKEAYETVHIGGRFGLSLPPLVTAVARSRFDIAAPPPVQGRLVVTGCGLRGTPAALRFPVGIDLASPAMGYRSIDDAT